MLGQCISSLLVDISVLADCRGQDIPQCIWFSLNVFKELSHLHISGLVPFETISDSQIWPATHSYLSNRDAAIAKASKKKANDLRAGGGDSAEIIDRPLDRKPISEIATRIYL
jgi:hypothetical protein